MKRAVNIRLDESMIYTLNQLAKELHTTKTDVITQAINYFQQKKQKQQNNLLQFAGKVSNREADKMLDAIQSDKNSKDVSLDL